MSMPMSCNLVRRPPQSPVNVAAGAGSAAAAFSRLINEASTSTQATVAKEIKQIRRLASPPNMETFPACDSLNGDSGCAEETARTFRESQAFVSPCAKVATGAREHDPSRIARRLATLAQGDTKAWLSLN